jgi:thioredoxin 1
VLPDKESSIEVAHVFKINVNIFFQAFINKVPESDVSKLPTYFATMTKVVKTDREFNEILKEAGTRLVVVDFFASWCTPCKFIAPELLRLEEENPDMVFLKVDIDDNSETAEAYDVDALPTFIFFTEGEKRHAFEGADILQVENTILQFRKRGLLSFLDVTE